MTHDLLSIAARFQTAAAPSAIEPHGSGHINASYRVTCGARDAPRYLLQKINQQVFTGPEQVMDNILRVTAHLRSRLEAAGEPDAARQALTVVPTRDGAPFRRDADGEYWRMYRFVENTRTYDAVTTPEQARQTGRAFGEFQRQLADLPAPRLHDTIPDFHNTPLRLQAFERALEADACNHAAGARDEIACALRRRGLAPVLQERYERGELPERIIHNDTKCNNVLLDAASGQGLCVIDLDTVMPGPVHYDFGDMVRTGTCPAEEDERDLAQVAFRPALFEALLEGYLATAGEFLEDAERRLLPAAGKVIIYEQGIRFLADHLQGDTYYRTHRPRHNLDRCRTQFKLLESMLSQEDEIERIAARLM